MAVLVTVDDIQQLGFDWPKHALVEEYLVIEQGKINLTSTMARLHSSQAYYRQQLADAFNFKMQHGTDYSDFTDRHDDDARMDRLLSEAIAYLGEIKQAVEEAS